MGVRRVAAVATVGMGLVLGAGLAPSATATPRPGPSFFGVEAKEGAHRAFRADAATLGSSRVPARMASKDAGARDSVAQLVASSRSTSTPLTEADIDVVELAGGSVVAAVPHDVELTDVSANLVGKDLEVTARTVTRPSALATGGPGMAPYWTGRGDGQYNLNVTGWGNTIFLWRRQQLINDGSSSYDWYSYARKALASPTDRPFAPDARIYQLKAGNEPTSTARAAARNWVDWSPDNSFTGDCSGSITASVSYLAASIGYTFNDCDKYVLTIDQAVPSRASLLLDQGLSVNGGSRSLAYSVLWKTVQGGATTQNDVNSVRWQLSGNTTTCASTNTSKTCAP